MCTSYVHEPCHPKTRHFLHCQAPMNRARRRTFGVATGKSALERFLYLKNERFVCEA
jgi:hypothetical protein